ncbi:MAG TPA: dTDP-glucose 4,6-dehydratase [Candidatus Paceibacterota bacterium]
MKHFLVTGGCGFMGSNFIQTVLTQIPDAKVVNLDKITYAANLDVVDSLPRTVRARYKFVKGDIANTPLVLRLMKKCDYVVNFAAETHVDRSIHNGADTFVHSNIVGVVSLLNALRKSPNVKKFVQISTDEVWGDLPIKSKKKFDENWPLAPNSPYSASKASAELMVRAFYKTYKLPVVTSRSVNNYGPRQFPEKLIPLFITHAMAGKKLPLYGRGENVRDWLYVGDHSQAIMTILAKGKIGEVYGVSRGEECSNLEIAKKILKILNKPTSMIKSVEDRPGHDRRYSVDSSKLRKLGWRPKYNLNLALSATIDWYKTQKNF